MNIPDTSKLLDTYGLATAAPAHLRALCQSDAGQAAHAAAVHYLWSAVLHQETPAPVTGPVVEYLAHAMSEGHISDAGIRHDVAEFLTSVQAVAERAIADPGIATLQRLAHPDGQDVDNRISQAIESAQLDELYEDDDLADAILARGLLGCINALPLIAPASRKIAAP